jgi:starch-binding outer membrane protein, SusD/RagB family
MKSYKIIKTATVVLTFAFIASCKKFVEIPPPTTELVTSSVLNNAATATGAQTVIYSQMVANKESLLMAFYTGLLGDELTNYSTNPPYVEFYKNAMTALVGFGPWDNAYNYIYQANAIITGITNNASISPSIENQLIGESKFVRAFWLFYLTNLYGDVPLITTTDYASNETISRTPQLQVYTQIVSDLISAESLLNSNYIDASDTTQTTERTRPNKSAAAALLAKVYLYEGDYADAKTQASSVINNSLYQLVGLGQDSVFAANSMEAIWQLAIPLPTEYNTPDGRYFILLAQPGSGGISCTISPQLLNSFEPGDLRRLNWIDSIQTNSPAMTYYYPYKYKVQNGSPGSSPVTEYNMVFRLAEQYLIRAEAEANVGDMADAANDLNIIRARAGLAPSTILTASSNLQQADSAILHERQAELFTEWGNRWLDMIRLGYVNSIMGAPGNVCQYKTGTWSLKDTLFPIPQSEIFLDHNLTQNVGY